MDEMQLRLPERRIAAALAQLAYHDDIVRLTTTDISGYDCLVSCNLGVYAVARDGRVQRVLYGFFHGIHRDGDSILLFEIGDRPRLPHTFGRIIRIALEGGQLGKPRILAKGLDNKGHQLAVFDGMIHLVDTFHQRILRFTPQGHPIDAIAPFPLAHAPVPGALPGPDYLHINCIARIGERIGLMLHNGKRQTRSEIAWFTPDWQLLERETIEGHGCHDIVADTQGTIWSCGSMAGEILNSRGLRQKVTDRMTRGLAVTDDRLMVGVSTFGPREVRDNYTGTILFLDRQLHQQAAITVPSAPMDLVAIHDL